MNTNYPPCANFTSVVCTHLCVHAFHSLQFITGVDFVSTTPVKIQKSFVMGIPCAILLFYFILFYFILFYFIFMNPEKCSYISYNCAMPHSKCF